MINGPIIEKRAICITNDPTLSAVISSYFHAIGFYFTTFQFHPDREPQNIFDVIQLNRSDVIVNNSIKRIKPDFVVLAGLNEYQRNFFDYVPVENKIIINNLSEVQNKLSPFKIEFSGLIECQSRDIVAGLYEAKTQKKKLVINEEAELVEVTRRNKDVAICLEKTDKIDDIVAVNYACCIDADLILLEPFPQEEMSKIHRLVFQWGNEHKESILNQLRKKVRRRLSESDISKYKFASFFTDGLPYGFVFKNSIPISHVLKGHILQYFIFNNIYTEEYGDFSFSTLIFSPQLLSKEEHGFVSARFIEKYYLVKELLGKNATVENFRNHVQLYPYDLLHIATHGGSTTGMYVHREFTDRTGIKHQLQFIEVATFASTGKTDERGEPLIAVYIKSIPRYLDRYEWNTPEFRAQKFPKYLIEDMWEAARHENSKEDRRIPIRDVVPEAVIIECYDGMDQGLYHEMASGLSPIVFNNTCNSWGRIAHGFIGNGARGYVGTLWKIGNETAVKCAEIFYKNVFQMTLLEAFYKMIKSIDAKQYKDIYIYWGLHFSRLYFQSEPDISNFLATIHEHAVGGIRLLRNPDKDIEVKQNAKDALKFITEILRDAKSKTELEDVERAISEADNIPASKEGGLEESRNRQESITEKECKERFINPDH